MPTVATTWRMRMTPMYPMPLPSSFERNGSSNTMDSSPIVGPGTVREGEAVASPAAPSSKREDRMWRPVSDAATFSPSLAKSSFSRMLTADTASSGTESPMRQSHIRGRRRP